jgi:CubicO group peptidase (beta-lactamase class C family)
MRAFALVMLSMLAVPALAQPVEERVDAVFAPMARAESPGCAVGVSRGGTTILTRAYGSADLEHDVPNAPSTIFEAGSVSKQFTAAAILLLVEEGKLRLTDDIRRFVPELPDYGATITIDHLLNHTSGLRDWGSVMDLAGWPRGTRAYTMDDVLAIVSRQQRLNYAPGAEYSYTNSGYNLLAIIVQRVSGSSLADYTRRRIFEPLGMRSTSWRDDFRRVVRGRAIAYSPAPAGFEQAMPFEDAYGNGGLLTNVEDLLTWNEALSSGRLGARVSELLAAPARLNGGRPIPYARGLFVESYRGIAEISHGGATGGYRAFLARYPDTRLSVALLCNVASANPDLLAHQVADLFLPTPAPAPAAGAAAIPPPAYATGTYVNERTGMPLRLAIEDGKLRVVGGPVFEAAAPNRFQSGRTELSFANADSFTMLTPDRDATYRRTEAYAPDAAALGAFLGRYASAEAGAEYVVTLQNGKLALRSAERPHLSVELVPTYRDAYTAAGALFRFRRDQAGRVIALSAGNARVRELSFSRVGPAARAR